MGTMRQQMPQGKEITTPADADSNKLIDGLNEPALEHIDRFVLLRLLNHTTHKR
jgi:hypothetical protein